jgi:hypothetical protein
VGIQGSKIEWLLFHNGIHRLHVRLAPECPLARKHLVENGTEVKEVGPVIYGFPSHLFGRHVAYRPQHQS